MFAHQREEEVFLGRDIAVERGGLHADLGGKLAHGHRLVAVARHQRQRRLAQGRLGAPTVGTRRSRHDRRSSKGNNKTDVQLIQVEEVPS
jgi:hypothetical protein